MPASRASSSVAFGGDFVAVLGLRGVVYDVLAVKVVCEARRGRDCCAESADVYTGT